MTSRIRTIATRVASRAADGWRRYWFGASGQLSIEMVRIALAVGALVMWDRAVAPDYSGVLSILSAGGYNPVGILRVFGSSPPPLALLEACKWIALVASAMMLVGLAARVATVVSLLSLLVVVGMRDAIGSTWHHSYTPILAAHLAFALAPCGRRLAVDALIRRRRGRTAAPATSAWPAFLVQIAVAIPYCGAAVAKLTTGRGLGWALSDNLRHQILARYDWTGHPRTPLADLLVESEVLWKMAALGNLASQLAPVVACFFVRRPLIRFLLGCFFIIETIALDLVMDLPNYQWLPLGVVFVDWDRLVGWLGARVTGAERREEAPAPPAHPRLVNGFIGGFLAVHLAITFGPKEIDQRVNSYPISQYTMFSQIRAKRPLSEHQSWEFDTLRFQVEGKKARLPFFERRLDSQFNKHFPKTPEALDDVLRQAQARLGKSKARVRLTAIFNILQVPAYPAEATLEAHPVGILGRLRGDRVESLLGRAGSDELGHYIEPEPRGVGLPEAVRVTCIVEKDPRPRELAVTPRGRRLYYQPLERGRHICAVEVGGESWVIAVAQHRR